MDGLVLDTELTYCIAWQKASLEMGCEFSKEFCLSMSGLHAEDVERKLIAHGGDKFDLAHFGALSGRYWRQYVNKFGIPVKQGFINLSNQLKENNITFCLATNSRRVNALECIQLAKIDNIFSTIVTRDDVKQGKPAADIFLFAAKIMGMPISKCLVVEDSATGIQAAVNATAPSVFIPSVLPFDEVAAQQADHLMNNLDELAEIIFSAYTPHD